MHTTGAVDIRSYCRRPPSSKSSILPTGRLPASEIGTARFTRTVTGPLCGKPHQRSRSYWRSDHHCAVRFASRATLYFRQHSWLGTAALVSPPSRFAAALFFAALFVTALLLRQLLSVVPTGECAIRSQSKIRRLLAHQTRPHSTGQPEHRESVVVCMSPPRGNRSPFCEVLGNCQATFRPGNSARSCALAISFAIVLTTLVAQRRDENLYKHCRRYQTGKILGFSADFPAWPGPRKRPEYCRGGGSKNACPRELGSPKT